MQAEDNEVPAEQIEGSAGDEDAEPELQTPPGKQVKHQAVAKQSSQPAAKSALPLANDPAKESAAVQSLLEEYHKLDYEDMVAGIPIRFPYKQVRSSAFSQHLRYHFYQP